MQRILEGFRSHGATQVGVYDGLTNTQMNEVLGMHDEWSAGEIDPDEAARRIFAIKLGWEVGEE